MLLSVYQVREVLVSVSDEALEEGPTHLSLFPLKYFLHVGCQIRHSRIISYSSLFDFQNAVSKLIGSDLLKVNFPFQFPVMHICKSPIVLNPVFWWGVPQQRSIYKFLLHILHWQQTSTLYIAIQGGWFHTPLRY